MYCVFFVFLIVCARLSPSLARQYAGYDKSRGFQLYVSDPSGNYSGWKATAIGQNYQVPWPSSQSHVLLLFVLPSQLPGLSLLLRSPHMCFRVTARQSAQSTLKSDFKEDLTWEESLKLAIKTLIRAMDTASPTAKKIEIQVLQRWARAYTFVFAPSLLRPLCVWEVWLRFCLCCVLQGGWPRRPTRLARRRCDRFD